MFVCALIVVATIAAASPAAADVMCYACNSYMAQCKFDNLATNTNNNVFQARCSSKCFTRQGEDEAIYRGCFDAFKAVKQLTDDYVGCRNQTWNNRVRRWCLCDTDLCNRFSIEQNYQPLPSNQPHRRLRTHHHPLPPPKPAAAAKIYLKDSDIEFINLNGKEKGNQQASYRTVWTNWQAVPGQHHHGQPASRRSESTERKEDGGSRTRDSRTQSNLDHVVSHSVYPEQWKANVAALVDRRHAKSSENVATGRSEPLSYSGEGQMSRSNYSVSRSSIQQYQPPTGEPQARSAPTTARQSSRDVAKKVQYDYAVHDFESDSENATAELDQLEYPYNQEITHQAVWTPFDDYLTAAHVDEAPRSIAEQPQVAKSADDDQSVDYPYNQDHGALLENFDLLDNGLWKEASEDDETGKEEEDLGLIVDYPYNQLFGQDASEFPVLTGYYENAATERQKEVKNASTAPVEHTVHTVDFPDFDVVDLASPPTPRHHIYHSYPAAPVSPDQSKQPRRATEEDTALQRSKTGQQLMAEINLEKTRFVPVPAALVDQRHQPARQSNSESRDADDSAESNVGRRRHELAKEGVDSLDYVESFADIQMAPEDKLVLLPSVPQIRCVHTGYYQNPKDCTQFVACLFDHNTRTKVLHLMRCPSGLVWDNVHKLCMESSSTCHAALGSNQSTPIDSYMQYFAKLAAAAAHDDNGDTLTQPRVKEHSQKS